MAFKLIDLPYADTALDPAISAETLSYHHGKHHQGTKAMRHVDCSPGIGFKYPKFVVHAQPAP